MDPEPAPGPHQPSPPLTVLRRYADRVRRARLDPTTAALVLVVAAGCAVRVGFWWQDRSFWRDELALVQSLETYSPRQLLGPLSDAQSAPPMWLWAERAVTTVLGDGERAYRLLPLLAGCAALVLLAMVSVRLIRRRPLALIPVALAATIPEVVFYGAQAKQYTTDLALVCLLLLLGVRLLRPPDGSDGALPPRDRTLLAWYAALALAPWFSHGFMLTAPLAAAWTAWVLIRRGRLTWRRAAVGLVVPAASVLVTALWARSLTGRVSAFTEYWAAYLGPHGADPARWVRWHGFLTSELLTRELGGRIWWLAGLLLLAGVAVACRRHPAVTVLLLAPVLSAYAAAVAGVYPFGHRLVMFCLPSLLVLFGLAADGLAGVAAYAARRFSRRRVPPPAGALVGGVIGLALIASAAWCTPARLAFALQYQYGVDDYRSALDQVGDGFRDGDLLIVGNGDRAAARVYASRVGLPADRVLRAFPGRDATRRTDCGLPEVVAKAERIWLVSGDLVTIYGGVTSRYAITAPLTHDFRQVHQHVRGQVTLQLLEPGVSDAPQRARCLGYAPVGVAGDPAFPDPLPTPR